MQALVFVGKSGPKASVRSFVRGCRSALWRLSECRETHIHQRRSIKSAQGSTSVADKQTQFAASFPFASLNAAEVSAPVVHETTENEADKRDLTRLHRELHESLDPSLPMEMRLHLWNAFRNNFRGHCNLPLSSGSCALLAEMIPHMPPNMLKRTLQLIANFGVKIKQGAAMEQLILTILHSLAASDFMADLKVWIEKPAEHDGVMVNGRSQEFVLLCDMISSLGVMGLAYPTLSAQHQECFQKIIGFLPQSMDSTLSWVFLLELINSLSSCRVKLQDIPAPTERAIYDIISRAPAMTFYHREICCLINRLLSMGFLTRAPNAFELIHPWIECMLHSIPKRLGRGNGPNFTVAVKNSLLVFVQDPQRDQRVKPELVKLFLPTIPKVMMTRNPAIVGSIISSFKQLDIKWTDLRLGYRMKFANRLPTVLSTMTYDDLNRLTFHLSRMDFNWVINLNPEARHAFLQRAISTSPTKSSKSFIPSRSLIVVAQFMNTMQATWATIPDDLRRPFLITLIRSVNSPQSLTAMIHSLAKMGVKHQEILEVVPDFDQRLERFIVSSQRRFSAIYVGQYLIGLQKMECYWPKISRTTREALLAEISKPDMKINNIDDIHYILNSLNKSRSFWIKWDYDFRMMWIRSWKEQLEISEHGTKRFRRRKSRGPQFTDEDVFSSIWRYLGKINASTTFLPLGDMEETVVNMAPRFTEHNWYCIKRGMRGDFRRRMSPSTREVLSKYIDISEMEFDEDPIDYEHDDDEDDFDVEDYQDDDDEDDDLGFVDHITHANYDYSDSFDAGYYEDDKYADWENSKYNKKKKKSSVY